MNDHVSPLFADILDRFAKPFHICDDCPIYGDTDKMRNLCKNHCKQIREGDDVED